MLYEVKIRENRESYIDHILTLDIPKEYNIKDIIKRINNFEAYDIESINLYALPGDIKIKDIREESFNDTSNEPLRVINYNKLNTLSDSIKFSCLTLPLKEGVEIIYNTKEKCIDIYIEDIPEEHKNDETYEMIGEYVYKLGLTFAILKWKDIKDKI